MYIKHLCIIYKWFNKSNQSFVPSAERERERNIEMKREIAKEREKGRERERQFGGEREIE